MRLGIDIGGTKTAALVLDGSGGIVAQVAAPSGRGNAQVLTMPCGPRSPTGPRPT